MKSNNVKSIRKNMHHHETGLICSTLVPKWIQQLGGKGHIESDGLATYGPPGPPKFACKVFDFIAAAAISRVIVSLWKGRHKQNSSTHLFTMPVTAANEHCSPKEQQDFHRILKDLISISELLKARRVLTGMQHERQDTPS
jgi:hypothetical protein